MTKKDQIIIIGGGPAGLSAAIYLGRYFHPVILIDAPEKVHGRTAMATNLANFLGHFETITGKEFLRRAGRQLDKLPVERKNEKVIKVSKKINGSFEVLTDKPARYEAKFVIVAVGLSDNMPDIEGLGPYYDTALFHCITCDWYEHRNKKTVIISDTDKGILNALKMSFYHRPPEISVVPSKKNPSYSQRLQAMAKKAKIKIYFSPIAELMGKAGKLEKIMLADDTLISAEVIFTRLGQTNFDEFLKAGEISVRRDEDGFIKVDPRTFESSQKNLFAVGPCNDMTDQVIVAGGEGALAAFEIDQRILAAHGIK